MCKYCMTDENEDVIEKQIISEELDAGFLGGISVINQIDARESALKLTMINDKGDVQEYVQKIRFCPFCGREIRDICS